MNIINLDSLSLEERGYLAGFYLGDGYAYYNKKDRHYSVDFYLNSIKDQDIKEKIIILLNKLNLKHFEKKDKRYNCTRIRVNSKQFYNHILETNNLELLNPAKEHLNGFLSGFIDAEGYVTKGEITITQQNKVVLDKIVEICNMLEIKTRKMWKFKNEKTPNEIWRLRISTDIKNYNHISTKIARIYSGAIAPHSE